MAKPRDGVRGPSSVNVLRDVRARRRTARQPAASLGAPARPVNRALGGAAPVVLAHGPCFVTGSRGIAGCDFPRGNLRHQPMERTEAVDGRAVTPRGGASGDTTRR